MSNDYKNSLLMMNTKFKMKGNLSQKEPEILKKWYEQKVYEKALAQNKGNKTFVLHDGPPYANGDIHLGHALNKIIKDFMVRYKTMRGYYAPYVPGWDTHGLPIETALTKKGKVDRKKMAIADFRDLCYDYAMKQVNNQREQFKRLGILGEWDNPYITLTKEYEAEQIKVFAKMAELGFIYKGLKPVYWSPSSETALAEAEIEYHDVTSSSIYLAFKVKDGKKVLNPDEEVVIWTTTPWTIPGNMAVCVNPKFEYSVVEIDNRKLVFASDLVESMADILGKEYKVIRKIKGKDLEGVTYTNPSGRICPVCLANHVTLDVGTTGLVHTAPGFGVDDFMVAKEYGIDILVHVDDKGVLTKESGKYNGLFYAKANQAVIDDLEKEKILLLKKEIVHAYPHDWRTRKPIIFRATPQWFASIEGMKTDMIDAISKVKWKPAWGEVRLKNMVKDRKEWCISRQRAWGVPIPVFYAEDGSPILDQKIMAHISDLFRVHGSAIWFRWSAKELLPKGYTHKLSPNGVFVKETDIMDVWFDSGSSHHAVLKTRGLSYPADVYFEGSDQYRGWFNSSLSTSVAMEKIAPYKAVVSHGFILDAARNKMSKSVGNVIDPQKVCNQYGADILRLWVSGCEYTSDIKVSNDILKQTTEAYRKIRNTFRFMLGNLSDFDNSKDRVSYIDMPEIDQYMECKLNKVLEKVYASFDEYSFDDVYHKILNYMSNDLSAFYFDFTKDTLYIDKFDSLARRSIQTVLFDNLDALIRVLNVFIPFTCDEIYGYMNVNSKKENVGLLHMKEVVIYDNNEEILSKYSKFMEFRNDVLKAIENARNNKIIGKSMNAMLEIYPNEQTLELLNSLDVDFASVFIVSGFAIKDSKIDGETFDSAIIKVTAKEGVVCDRCWKVVDHKSDKGLCDKCEKIIESLEV